MIKSLLASELKLTGSQYEEYDKIKVADMMAEKFPSDAGLGKLISFFSKIPELENTAKLLKKEKAKGNVVHPLTHCPEPQVSHDQRFPTLFLSININGVGSVTKKFKNREFLSY